MVGRECTDIPGSLWRLTPKEINPPGRSQRSNRGYQHKKANGSSEASSICWQFNEGGCTFGRACKFHMSVRTAWVVTRSLDAQVLQGQEAKTQLGSTVRGNCSRLRVVPKVVGVVVFWKSFVGCYTVILVIACLLQDRWRQRGRGNNSK